ncbi:hypothetical protein H0H92_004918 [Tricholoma furcatifolium]|nr:hypothetical protein H0H92_004918 [Tricholoma furcatifolium]
MIPLTPALSLSFFSFSCSVFTILRIVIPILPPSPLSKRVSPAEFGLPKYRSLSLADKCYIWLATLDIVTLVVFVWQVISEAMNGPSDFANASDPPSSVRLWLVMTVRQTCFLLLASITLLHVRMGRSVSFGITHWMLWAPTVVLTSTSTGIVGVISGAGLDTLFVGIISYTSTIAILSTVVVTCIIGTLFIIERNLRALSGEFDPCPPIKVVEGKSTLTEDSDVARNHDASGAGSSRASVLVWSCSTHHTGATSPQHGNRVYEGSYNSVQAKSSCSSINVNDIPHVPPLPSPYDPVSSVSSDFPPFGRGSGPAPAPENPRVRLDSQTSWLTSTNGSHSTISAWSYPASGEAVPRISVSPDFDASRLATPQLANAQVLGGYGYAPRYHEAEKGLASLTAPPSIDILSLLNWLAYIWVPFVLSLPYLITVSQKNVASSAISILLTLSVSMSSPLSALTILYRSPIPVPSDLFDDQRTSSDADILRASRNVPFKWTHEHKHSMNASVTVVEGRRSGDVWLSDGNAIDGRSRMGRAVGMLSPMPKLSVLPPEGDETGKPGPPLPIQDENSDSSVPINLHHRSHSENSAQFGRLRKGSKASSHLSDMRESLTCASKIMIAQRHYSALAQTVVVPSTLKKPSAREHPDAILSASGATTSNAVRHSAHLRARSVSSINAPESFDSDISFHITPPPSIPLPPTPPSVKTAPLEASSIPRESISSKFFSDRVGDSSEIDVLLRAGAWPLVPGINTDAMEIIEGYCTVWTPPVAINFGKSRCKKHIKIKDFEGDFSSPQVHSTPARGHEPEQKSAHMRKMSLPSLGLGKDGALAHRCADVRGTLESKGAQYYTAVSASSVDRRSTVFAGDTVPSTLARGARRETEGTTSVNLNHFSSTRSLGLHADVPHGLDTPRESITSLPPISAASMATLFDVFTASLDGPAAQSTPHNRALNEPGMSKCTSLSMALPEQKHSSSIIYVKESDCKFLPTPAAAESTTSSPISTIMQWSSRAVRPLITKATLKLQHKRTNADSTLSGSKSGYISENLRPLMLLRARDSNADASPVKDTTRPLTLGRKQMTRETTSVQDENVYPSMRSKNKGLKPLKLARSDTSKMRGLS